jgi:cytochrome c oxidase cbb3-type subunit 3
VRPLFTCSLSVLAFTFGSLLLAGQTPAPPAKPAAPTKAAARPARPKDYPDRPVGDPAKIAHGKQLFGVNCAFCHGSDARGGETGTNLVRSQLVLDDQNGELMTPVVQNGRIPKGMPSFPLSAADISDIAAFVHSLRSSARDGGDSAPINILVGDAAAGKAYFDDAGKCSTCHSVTGDLAGIGSRLEPKALQNAIVAGVSMRRPGARDTSHRPETTATITLPSGQKHEGRLVYRDAFFVSIVDAEGNHRSFPADAPGTKIEVHNPLQAHLDMLATWKDSDIHNLTKYLSTIK